MDEKTTTELIEAVEAQMKSASGLAEHYDSMTHGPESLANLVTDDLVAAWVPPATVNAIGGKIDGRVRQIAQSYAMAAQALRDLRVHLSSAEQAKARALAHRGDDHGLIIN